MYKPGTALFELLMQETADALLPPDMRLMLSDGRAVLPRPSGTMASVFVLTATRAAEHVAPMHFLNDYAYSPDEVRGKLLHTIKGFRGYLARCA